MKCSRNELNFKEKMPVASKEALNKTEIIKAMLNYTTSLWLKKDFSMTNA